MFTAQIAMLKNSCKATLKSLKGWMVPEKVRVVRDSIQSLHVLFQVQFSICVLLQAKTSMTTFPSSAEIVSEPLGVILIISAWNYPFCMSKFCSTLFCFRIETIEITFNS